MPQDNDGGAIVINAISTAKMSRDKWLALRRRGIGGSDMGKILGVSEWGTAVDVWLEKTGRKASEPENVAMWIGSALEDAVARRYADEKCVRVVRHNFLLWDDENHIVGNLDRLVQEYASARPAYRGDVRTPLGLEVKTSGGAPWAEVPEHYKAQVHTYMALAPSIMRFDVAVLFYGMAKEFRVFSEPRDDAIVDGLRMRCREWWERHVVGDAAPEPVCEDDCRNLWGASRDRKVIASQSVVEAVDAIKRFGSQVAALEASIGDMKTLVMSAMEDGDVLVGAGGAKLATWRSNKECVKTDWKAVALEAGASPDLIARFTEHKPGARVFRVS
jgi:putative phage-type endonuclease